jgi:hypothetical protein
MSERLLRPDVIFCQAFAYLELNDLPRALKAMQAGLDNVLATLPPDRVRTLPNRAGLKMWLGWKLRPWPKPCPRRCLGLSAESA